MKKKKKNPLRPKTEKMLVIVNVISLLFYDDRRFYDQFDFTAIYTYFSNICQVVRTFCAFKINNAYKLATLQKPSKKKTTTPSLYSITGY